MVDDINTNRGPKTTLELIAPSRLEDGASDIVEVIKRNIDKSLINIFDITNVTAVIPRKASEEDGEEDGEKITAKTYPNANVVFELSYALQRKRKDQVVLVRKKRGDEMSSDSVPFDFRQHNHVPYDSPAQLRHKLNDLVTGTLERMNFIAPLT